MDEASFIGALISKGQPVAIRLMEGKDLYAIPIAHDTNAIIIKRNNSDEISLVYKKAISVITPAGG